jgi:molybdate transport system substrate-binding protein
MATTAGEKTTMRLHLVAAATCGILLLNGAQAAEVKVLASGAVKEAALELIPQFEKTSGHKIAVTWAGTVDIKKKVAAGEAYDLVIVAAPELDGFIKDGKIAAGSKVDIVRSSVGVAVKPGVPKPDLKSGDDLKKALLTAKSVGYSTGPSGVYMQSLFAKMGIADDIKAKAKQTGPGVPVATVIRSGEAEIGFQQVSELIHEPGIDFLGPIPPDVQNVTVFSSGVFAGAKAPTEARLLQKYLTAPAAAPVIKKHGLERPARVPSAS